MTRSEIFHLAKQRLTAAGLEDPLREARLLLCTALQCDGAEFLAHGEKPLTSEEEKTVLRYLEQRAKHMPLGRVRGKRDFWKSSFILNEATLEPRPDSETLIEAVLEIYSGKKPPKTILDIGTGTGCLLLSLLQEFPGAKGVGTDKSAKALEAAEANAKALNLQSRVRFVETHWADGVNETFDLIVSNPPYIASHEISGLAPEVRLYDPALALDGGEDGLSAYRALANAISALLAPGGVVILEIGIGQAEDVSKLFMHVGFKNSMQKKDLGGVVRAVGLQK